MIRYALRDPVQRKYVSLLWNNKRQCERLKELFKLYPRIYGTSKVRSEIVEVEVKLKRRA